ncbi:MAG: RNA-binding S4 domain-containing protein [Candidatus Gastranaerophilales bacterium]|nr:RNA-binding S4 domain-containing protein [Candidatus Gastranaerophilales bacterium]
MRLDKYLKVSRLIKRRTVANDVSDQGRIYVNDNVAKPSKQLKEGDVIKIVQANKNILVKVVKIPIGNVSIQESSSLYQEICE